jgi:EAL domain-containing protein (putative c-di-GMP-specific phosphodiesterase class I)
VAYAIVDERVVGFEALVRWRHPERGLIQPGQFIHIAEDTGLIMAIGSWVLSRVCAQLARWPEEIRVSANLSALQIRPELVAEVEQQLAQHRITPERLVLEITERLVLDPSIKPVIASLRAIGVQVALDDFGTGYSSLGSVQRFPLDVVKLDRTLIDPLAEGSGEAVIRAAVELGQALGVTVIAEGIENQTQLNTLRELGCPLGQGFLFAKPLPVADAQRLMQTSANDTGPASRQAA